MFDLSDNFYPSIYLGNLRLSASDKVEMIEGRINEAYRMAERVRNDTYIPKIIPYFWYKYHDTKQFVSKASSFHSHKFVDQLTFCSL